VTDALWLVHPEAQGPLRAGPRELTVAIERVRDIGHRVDALEGVREINNEALRGDKA
jgi:hypothetical protein